MGNPLPDEKIADYKKYCVVSHSSENGYVVRTSYNNWLPQPYSNVTVIYSFDEEQQAQECADKLNEY